MAVKTLRVASVTPVRVPVYNINSHVRVPGRGSTPLGKALQEWSDEITISAHMVTDPETPGEKRREYRIYITTEEGRSFITVTEQIYEVALYTRATKRFTDWMRANGKG